MKRGLLRFAITLMALVFAVAIFVGAKGGGGRGYYAQVTKVYDGDTIVIDGKTTVRYLGIDTPEKDAPDFEMATQANKDLVIGKRVRVVPCLKRPKDKYGRTLALVYSGRDSITEALLQSGQGRVFDDVECNGRSGTHFWQLMIEAYKNHRGIWKNAPNFVDAANTGEHLNQDRIVVGTVTRVQEGPGNRWINFGPKWQSKDFSIRLPKKGPDVLKMSGRKLEDFVGKRVTVVGHILKWNYGPFITCRSPAQILSVE